MSGPRDKIRSLAEKALLSSIFGKLTQKTFARVYDLFFESIDSWVREPRIIVVAHKGTPKLRLPRVYGILMASSEFCESEVNQFESSIRLRLNV